ncbi:hypothetical protein [uncultured Christiangramia sp.]|uniref:hypothetical protein n=1 Tax=uncultured Christiangramia sp. TaxID=503836 RepID=UPI0026271CFE|nr:hypothetical protein [uncultured Christiangramia sp.]
MSRIFDWITVLIVLFLNICPVFSQITTVVDENGIIRWEPSGEEVKGFGVNYSAPFAHAYRSGEKLGLDIKAEIDKDLYHFSRLNFDLYRLHVWDTEISDADGNLLQNEHLDAFDYLLSELKKREINFVITPIAYWGNGWPEPDEDTPGFSNKYGKEGSLTNPKAVAAQQNYLTQFMNHVNPYTGIAYKNDPNLIAVEISNEPHHRGTPEEVKEFINKLAKAIRDSGSQKPVFYNVTHSVHLADTYFESDIQGGTFQWYPTGLGFKKEIPGNLLPNVNDYNIPFSNAIENNNAAKLVYEFDAADVNKSYIYPAMARSFREAGIQIGTHFAYDPSFLAYANTEYNTHYMNLNYTPHKALGLMIAGEIFHHNKLGEDQGTYPENLKFGDFLIQYEDDLAVYNSAEKFIYTNSNAEKPKAISELREIAGHGSSEVIEYDGKGAYFLDKLEEGVWRLEVMPDPFLIKDPFGNNSLEKTIAVIRYNLNEMKIAIPGLAGNFEFQQINIAESEVQEAEAGAISISPGTYLLTQKGQNFDIKNYKGDFRLELDNFVAVEESVERTYVLHEAVNAAEANQSFSIDAEIVSNEEINKAEIWFQNGNSYEAVEMKAKNQYDYSADVPQNLMVPGILTYRIILETTNGKRTFPGNVSGSPENWDFYSEDVYSTRICDEGSAISLFDASMDADMVVHSWKPGNQIVPLNSVEDEFQVRLDELFSEDIENKNATPIYDYSFRFNFQNKIRVRLPRDQKELIIKARNLKSGTEKLQVALLMKNGSAFGKVIELDKHLKEIRIKLDELRPVKTVTLPRPYPGFLPYYFEHQNPEGFDLQEVEALQFSIGPGIEPENLQKKHEIGIVKVTLQ